MSTDDRREGEPISLGSTGYSPTVPARDINPNAALDKEIRERMERENEQRRKEAETGARQSVPKVETGSLTKELSAMKVIAEALEAMDPETRQRVLAWVVDRYQQKI